MANTTGTRARRFRIDPRFVVGVVLVAGSIAGVWGLLAAQDRTVQVLAARTTLVPGETVRADDLQTLSVRLPSGAVYATPRGMPEHAVVVRTVRKGELVPLSALGDAADEGSTSVVVKASGPVSATVVAGSAVDVWAARPTNEKGYRPPTVLASSATVVSVLHDDALVADRGTVSVEVRVPSRRVAAVLQATADGQVLSVVPAGTPAAEPGEER